MDRHGPECTVWPPDGCLNRALRIRGRMKGLPSNTQGGSPVPESGPPGFVRGAHSNMRPYRDRRVFDPTKNPSVIRQAISRALH